MSDDRQALEQLVMDQDLEELENLLDEFNIFEVLGAVRVELRHSEFLAYLMNPQQNHGLGDDFVKKFLQKALVNIDQSSLAVSAIDVDVWGFDEIEIKREWNNIDILLLSDDHKFAVVIENKIYSNEHSNQLQRYRNIMEQNYPNWKTIYIFLTPEGDIPSDKNYIPVSYELVCSIIENIIETRKNSLGNDVRTIMQHYSTMLRRHILSNSKIQDLSRKIYKKHKVALDLIYENKPDTQLEMFDYLSEMIKETPNVILEYSTKSYIRFMPKEWDIPFLKEGGSWVESGMILLFEFINQPNRLRMKLGIGPGPKETREVIFDMTEQENGLKLPPRGGMGKDYGTIYMRDILSKDKYKDAFIDDLFLKVKTNWEEFLKTDFERIKSVVQRQDWFPK
jgi:hypothetical protein